MSELFRFMVFRPPSATDPSDTKYVQLENPHSAFQRDLGELLQHEGTPQRVADLAREFVASEEYVAGLDRLSISLAGLADRLEQMPPADLATLNVTIESALGHPAAELVERADFVRDRSRIADSVIALTLLHREREPVYFQLVLGARLCRLVERAAAEDGGLAAQGAIANALEDDPLILPPALFPVRASGNPATEDSGEEAGGPAAAETLTRRLEILRTALDELAAVPTTGFRGPTSPSGDLELRAAVRTKPPEPGPARTATVERASYRPGAVPWLLAESGINRLSKASRGEIARLGLALDTTPMPEISAVLEGEFAHVAADVYRAGSPARLVRVGSTFVDADALVGPVIFPKGEVLQAITPVQEAAFRELGVADLMMVREELRGYKLGEIAHIENVLHGESKERTHRRLDRRLETVLTEREKTETTERDQQSTERFELQRETQQTINQESSFDVGVTVKYGGFVDVEASTNYSTKNASELSTRAAANYSREMVDHSVSRIQERVREQRVLTTLEEIEETNLHKLTAPNDHVVGMYRWVDKVQDVQVLNYGKRTMYEFIVPEPAVFALFARAKQLPKGMTLQEPKPPTFGPQELMWDWPTKRWVWVARPIEPLRPHHLQWWNYQQWVAQYQTDVEPPPPQYVKKNFTWQSAKLQGDARGDAPLAWEGKTASVDVPAGYAAVKAYIYVYQTGGFARNETWVGVTVGEISSPAYDGNSGYIDDFWYTDLKTQNVAKVEGSVPITVAAIHGNIVSVEIEVLCECTDAAMDKWREKAYGEITTAYQNLKSAYEEQLAAALTQAGIAISGRNPGLNREAEQVELKREAITLLAHKWWPHLEGAGSIVPNRELYPKNAPGATEEFPEIDFKRFDTQAPLIQFLEQAFEWTHMVYSFYPYFWARKAAWPLLQQLDDTDPIYARFLRGGAARVLVPVREGYSNSLRHYWLTGQPWLGAGLPPVTDSAYLPIIEELKEKYGIDFHEGKGTLSVIKDSAVVTGSAETEFGADDVRREIRFKGKTFRVRAVDAAERQLTLDEAYRGPTEAGVIYAISEYKLVGDPWPVTLPTTLTYLQQDATLPAFPRE